jgi:2-keto-4-pentenoate hydratase/2-oxohepta-3-ene-1,7-dioic acid hydratase in catechol pathway
MANWIRFLHQQEPKFGTVVDNRIVVHSGDMFDQCQATGEEITFDNVELQIPCVPEKVLALWNNFHATSEKTGLPKPEHPWYFVKTPNTYAPAYSQITRPRTCQGKILFEGELGIAIGKPCSAITPQEAKDYVFGYTCINDVTALEYLFKEEAFAHWSRAKCFDGFAVIGPGITTDIDPSKLVVRTFLEGDGQVQERQNYPVRDMIYSPYEIVSHLSHDMTLKPGDIIACGTSIGAGAMKDGWTVRIEIEGIGELINTYSDS